MQTLFLDLASNLPVIALCSENEVLAIKQPGERVSDTELVPLLEQVLGVASNADIGRDAPAVRLYDNIDRIACVVGPGGFTSLRMAVVCCNTLADQLEIPTASVHLTELYEVRVDLDQARPDIWFWIHSTKKDEVFIKGGEWKQPIHLKLDEVLKKLPAEFSVTGELLEQQQTMIEAQGGKELKLAALEEVLPEFLNNLKYDKSLLTPWYGRKW